MVDRASIRRLQQLRAVVFGIRRREVRGITSKGARQFLAQGPVQGFVPTGVIGLVQE